MANPTNQHELQETLNYWQHRLGLENWDIRIEWLSKDEAVSDAYACVYVDQNHRVACAKITPEERLQSPDVIPKGAASLMVYNPEKSVVHELVHILLYEYGLGVAERSELHDMMLERFINLVADALIATRGDNGEKELCDGGRDVDGAREAAENSTDSYRCVGRT